MSYFYPAQSQTKYHRSPSIPILGFACTTGTVHSPIFQESWLCCLLPSSLLLLSLPLPQNCARRNDGCQCNLALLKPSWSLLLSKSRLKVSHLCVSGVGLVLTLFPQVVKKHLHWAQVIVGSSQHDVNSLAKWVCFSRWFASLTVVAGCLWLHRSGPGVGMGWIRSSSAPRPTWSRKSTKLMLPTTLFAHSPLAPTRGHCNLSWWRIVEVIRHFFCGARPAFPCVTLMPRKVLSSFGMLSLKGLLKP